MAIDNNQIDLAIVGAGWHGLAMAKTYSEAYPQAQILVFDTAKSIGGVWAKERLYPGLKTNNLVGSYEFGDFPMDPVRFGVKAGQHIPGAVVHEYLRQFAVEYGLISSLRLQTAVSYAELLDNGFWKLGLSDTKEILPRESSITAKKLVVATGLTSKPSIPTFPGRDDFQGSVLHSIHLKDRAKEIAAAKEVVVIGANKSAWDTCYSAAVAGAQVHMVIRPSGGGPSWVWPVTITRWKLSVQRLATTRLWTLFDPCIWAAESSGFLWARHLLHRTWAGGKIVSIFWKILSSTIQRANGYDDHPELRKLKPWSSTFWMGNSLGIHNYEQNWFDLVRQGRILVHVAEVASLSREGVHFSNGIVVNADTLVCCTGWDIVPPIKFLPADVVQDLGLPCVLRVDTNDAIAQKARNQVLRMVPGLRVGPARVLPLSAALPMPGRESHEPGSSSATRPNYQLYRFMVPTGQKLLEQRNIAFMGAHLAINAVTVAQAQALWITAFFNQEIEHLKPSNMDVAAVNYQTILHVEYCKLRHPPEGGGAGNRCPDLCFDGLLYTDLLMRDLGLAVFRKGGFWKEFTHRYLPTDYKGAVAEWIEKTRKG